MTRSTNPTEPRISLRGVPAFLETLVPAEDIPLAPPLLTVTGVAGAIPVSFEPLGKRAMRLHASLPADTPPGEYSAILRLAGKDQPAVVVVHAEPQLVAAPGQLVLRVAPAAEVKVALDVVNTGNVTIDVPETLVFGVYDDDGIERAFSATYRSGGAGKDRLGTLVDRLAEGHGGLCRLRVVGGAGALEPHDLRRLDLRFHAPDQLVPGRAYCGTISLPGLCYSIRFVTQAAPGSKPT